MAYHALAAAYHCADALQSVALLTDVEALADEQMDSIDTHATEHRLSSQSAAQHGNASIFGTLARQAAPRAHTLRLTEAAPP